LHPTSLPSRFGIGDFGPGAFRWLDALAEAGQGWWQVLPLGPTGYGDSPYQCFSSLALNPLLISPEELWREGLISARDLEAAELPGGPVDYGRVREAKERLIGVAWQEFSRSRPPKLNANWEQFQQDEAEWLGDYGLFMAIKERFGGCSWLSWPEDLRLRDRFSLAQARRDFQSAITVHQFAQFLAVRQWQAVKQYASSRGVRIIGDMPIFLAEDSVDVWTNPNLFKMTADRRPRVVAGVPPDYFSPTGQRWGNPVYEWSAHQSEGFSWWLQRVRGTIKHVDLIRLDHFRGFVACWEIPAEAATAETGNWMPSPGAELLEVLQRELDGLPLIAEDLGVITPEVDALRQRFHLPGMRILQFAFGGAIERRFLPHNFENPTVVYPGTHDNDTTVGWYHQLSMSERDYFCRYLGCDGSDPAWDLIRAAWSSVAILAVAPVQDLLALGNEGRMNRPGTATGNWRWRMSGRDEDTVWVPRLKELTELYERSGRKEFVAVR